MWDDEQFSSSHSYVEIRLTVAVVGMGCEETGKGSPVSCNKESHEHR